MKRGERLRIRGRVQGVGFRPLVWRLANELKLDGSVCNVAGGVVIELSGAQETIDSFITGLQTTLPAIARIDAIERCAIAPAGVGQGFEIVASETGNADTDVAPDIATCPDCQRELFEASDRRYRYPFINCTHCGPRFSIVKAIPYDRSHTSMAAFTMCPACRAEYENPRDRRFHAQPNACPECGPSLWLEDNQGKQIDCDDVIKHTAQLIRDGCIVAIKGIAGFHLACDASNSAAVEQLRQRKQRPHKPLALLARDVEMVHRYAKVDAEEETLLSSPAAPIVLLDRAGECLAPHIAPHQNTLAFALAANPLHHLLMGELDFPIVLTSGNRSDEPPCIDNDEARSRLHAIADYFLLHERDIVNRGDDSVRRVMAGRPRSMRRARGYAPDSLCLPDGFETAAPLLAMGAELKSSFALLQQGRLIVSQHIGDLEHALALNDYLKQLNLYRRLYHFRPQAIAVDLHPDYLSSQQGRALAQALDVECIAVQHHHAHIAAVMAEHGLPLACEPVLGIALDGLGLGDDGTFWGGEFLLADYRGYRRLAHFDAVPLLGGMQAMKQPWRSAAAHLLRYFDFAELQLDYGDLDAISHLAGKPIATLQQMMQRRLNSPSSSSCGRLFDAVAALLGICTETCSYEGQAAIELEALAAALFARAEALYPVELKEIHGRFVLSWRRFWRALLDDLKRGSDRALIAARFHRSLIEVIRQVAQRLSSAHGVKRIVLGGGVFQNRLLLEGVTASLSQAGFELLSPAQFPANDGAVSLGQALVAAALRSKSSHSFFSKEVDEAEARFLL